MFFGRFRFCKIGPFNLFIDISWFFLAVLLVISFTGYAASVLHADRWSLISLSFSCILVFLFNLCLLIHELSHSVVGNKYGMAVREITLLFWGAVAHITNYPEKASHEFKTAIVGPLSNFVIAALLFAFSFGLSAHGINIGLYAKELVKLLIWCNLVLGIFNLLPAFPMDGGRILRSILWGVTKDQIKATKKAVLVSRIMALLMIVFGLWKGNFFLCIIAILLIFMAGGELKYLLARQKLSAVKVKQLMRQISPIPFHGRVLNINDCVACNVDATFTKALQIMQEKRVSAIYVEENGQIVGFIDIRDIQDFLAK